MAEALRPTGHTITTLLVLICQPGLTGQKGMVLTMKTNTRKEFTHLSLDEALKIMDKYPLNCLFNTGAGNGGSCDNGTAVFTFNKIKIERGWLRFCQENGTDMISFKLADISSNIYLESDERKIKFFLSNGEEWSVSPWVESEREPRLSEMYREIEIDEVLEWLSKCKRVGVSRAQSRIVTTSFYDVISIRDTADDIDWDGDREIQLELYDSQDAVAKCKIDLDTYDSMYYLDDKVYADIMCEIHIGLSDTPFTRLKLTLHTGEGGWHGRWYKGD